MITRRRLLFGSAPVVAAVLIVAAKLGSVAAVGNSAGDDYSRGDTAALSTDVTILRLFDVVEPAKTSYAAGTLAVLQNRLRDADSLFSDALAHTDTDQTCPVRVNLELVRETLGDQAAAGADHDTAVRQYTAARDTISRAPANCFAGNSDDDPQRRMIRAQALPRLDAKLQAVPPAAAAPPPPPPPPAAPVPESGSTTATSPPPRPAPDRSDPLHGLQQILGDAAQ